MKTREQDCTHATILFIKYFIRDPNDDHAQLITLKVMYFSPLTLSPADRILIQCESLVSHICYLYCQKVYLMSES